MGDKKKRVSNDLFAHIDEISHTHIVGVTVLLYKEKEVLLGGHLFSHRNNIQFDFNYP